MAEDHCFWPIPARNYLHLESLSLNLPESEFVLENTYSKAP